MGEVVALRTGPGSVSDQLRALAAALDGGDVQGVIAVLQHEGGSLSRVLVSTVPIMNSSAYWWLHSTANDILTGN